MSIQYVDANCDVLGTVAETFNISGSNDQVQLTIDGGSPQTFTLTHGAARTAAQVAADLNATLVSATAYAPTHGPQASKLRIRTTSSLGASSSIVVGAPSNNANATLGLTAATYTGYSRAHNSWTAAAGTKQELINQIETQLNSVGWTTISGSGTTNLLLESALTPPGQDLKMRLRCKDNAGSCVQVSVENVSGTKAGTNSTTAGASLLPAVGKTWLFTINKYQGFIRTPIATAAREFVGFGIPSIPTFLQGVIVECMWNWGNVVSDSDTNIAISPRTGLISNSNRHGNQCGICNGNVMQLNNISGTPEVGTMQLGSPGSQLNNGGATGYQWHDNSALLNDVLIGWGLTAGTDVGKWRGQLWEAALTSEAFTGDVTTSFDSHNWITLTDNNTGSGSALRGTVLLVTP